MVTATGNVSTLTSEYSEIARRLLEANLCALVGDRHSGKAFAAHLSERTAH